MSLTTIAKYIFLISLASLIFRGSSFALYHVPNPFEFGLIISLILTALDLTLQKQWKSFFRSIPAPIWRAAGVIVASILVGWGIAVFYRHIPTTANTIYEFAGFLVATLSALLTLYFSTNDPVFIRRCVYALLIPAAYSIFILIPSVAYTLSLAQDGSFHGLTSNVNTMAKTLMVPTAFAIVYALRSNQKVLVRVGYSLLSALLVGLLFWTIERASIVALLILCFIVWLAYWYSDRRWKHVLGRGFLLLLIFVAGFLTVPSSGKKATINRLLNFDANQKQYVVVEHQSVSTVLKESLGNKKVLPIATFTDAKKSPEPRFQLWGYYLRLSINNPLGLGPNTHMDAKVPYAKGIYVNPGPHNSFLEMLLWGGVIGLCALLYLVLGGIKQSVHSLKVSFQPFTLALLGSLIALTISIFFNDNLQSIWFWTVLALCLRL